MDSTVTIGGDITDLQAKLRAAGSSIQSFGTKARTDIGGIFSGAGGALSSLLPAASIAAAAGRVKGLMNSMDDLADTALRLNESTETLQRVEYATTLLAGVNLDGVTTSFLKLEKALGDVDNAAASQALERYGITAAGLTRLPLDEKIVTLAEAFQRARADGTGYNDLLALLGKSAGDLIPLLEQSGTSIRDAFADAPVILDATVQRMAAMNDQTDAFIAKQKSQIGDFASQALMALDEIFDPNKKLGDNTRSAAGTADKTLADQQAKRDAAAKALETATADKNLKAAATNEATRLLAVQRDLETIERSRVALGERQFQNLMHHLTPALQIQAIERRIGEEMQRQIDLRESGPLSESTEIANAEKMLTLEEQLQRAKQARAEAATAAAEKEAAALQKTADAATALADIQRTTDILRAQAGGDDKKAAALQRQADVQAAVKTILDATNLSEAEALRLAEEQQKLKEQIAAQNNQEKNSTGPRGGNKIDATIGEGGREGARARAEERLKNSRDRVSDASKKAFGTFAGEDTRLKDRFATEFGPAGQRQNPAAVDAAKNANNAATATAQNPATAAANIVQQALPEIVALLKGS